MLERSGFVQAVPCAPPPLQPDSALQAIRWAIAPVPAVLLLCSLVLAYFYPLTKAAHRAIRLQLAERKMK
jgi:GPH family glycoside/pentoside/hexuronide:cation symporter